MKQRQLGTIDHRVGEVGLGCWQFGGDFGPISEETVSTIITEALENGTTFFDTADVYGNGRSETLLGSFLGTSHRDIFIATKFGRDARVYPDNYTEQELRNATHASLKRLKRDTLNLTQLHCIPLPILQQGDIFEWLRKLKKEGKIEQFGASVESVEEALLCLEQDGLSSLQIIFNILRQKPIENLLPQAKANGIAIIVRLPLASGLLSGKFSSATRFAETDHRNYNRDGQHFNVGETFAGIPFDKGIELANSLKQIVPEGMTMAQMALRWILDHDAVSVIIPGASSPEQARANAKAADFPPLSDELHQTLADFYRDNVAALIRGPY